MSGTSASLQQQTAARYAAPGTTAGALDIALAYDETREGADLVWNGGDFALDRTPVTAMIMALGCDARADPGDTLPADRAGWAAAAVPPLVNFRRGWEGDGLDAQGRRTGSKLWLYARAKATEDARLGIQSAAATALAQVQTMLGVSITLAVRWVALGAIGLRASSGPVTLSISRRVG